MSSQRPRSSALEASRETDRPRSHAGTSDAEKAILEATERLLAEVPLHDLSVEQIIGAAEVSRATFYFYFSSKFAVVTGLLAQVMDEIFGVVQPFVNRQTSEAPADALRRSLDAAIAVWSAHRPALRATAEHWYAIPELRSRWLGVVERFTDAVAAEIDRERAAGEAPPGPDSRKIAAALLWGTERCLYVAGLGADDDLPSEQAIIEPLVALWVGGLYGAAPQPKARRAVGGKAPARRKRA